MGSLKMMRPTVVSTVCDTFPRHRLVLVTRTLIGAVERDGARLIRHERFVGGRGTPCRRPLFLAHIGEVVGAEDHVLRRDGVTGGRPAGRRRLFDREHENAGFRLRLSAQRNVDRHLVAVKVSVVCGAGQRVQLERAALNEHRLERLNAQTVQRRRAVEQNRVLLDDNIESVPDLGLLTRSTIFLADLMLLATPSSTSFFITNGLEELDAPFPSARRTGTS